MRLDFSGPLSRKDWRFPSKLSKNWTQKVQTHNHRTWPSGSPSSWATRLARLMQASRRGCVTTIWQRT
jgi:hypothetical protein